MPGMEFGGGGGGSKGHIVFGLSVAKTLAFTITFEPYEIYNSYLV